MSIREAMAAVEAAQEALEAAMLSGRVDGEMLALDLATRRLRRAVDTLAPASEPKARRK